MKSVSCSPAGPSSRAFTERHRLSVGGGRRLLVSDVGYGRYEEIDVVAAGGNYGWRIREGTHCLDVDQPLTETTDCPTGAAGEPLIAPVLEYAHEDVGVAVVGGYVYRGSAIAGLRDRYVFADFSADPDNNLSGAQRWRPQSIRDRDGRGRGRRCTS